MKTPSNGKSETERALTEARKIAMARAGEAVLAAPGQVENDLDEAECFVRLVIAMYSAGVKVGMGVMPDGMAIYIRLSMPKTSADPRAGMVSFVVSDDTQAVLRKAVDALEAAATSNYWKPDQFAR